MAQAAPDRLPSCRSTELQSSFDWREKWMSIPVNDVKCGEVPVCPPFSEIQDMFSGC